MSGDLSKETIQKEIEAKKKRLEELKQKRLQRQQKQDEPTTTLSPQPITSASPAASSFTHSQSLNQLTTNQSNESTADILDVVNSLITASPTVTQQQQQSGQSSESSTIPTPVIIPPRPVLQIAPQPSVSIPGVDLIHYDVAAQTNESFLVASAELGQSFSDENKQPLSPLSPNSKKKGRISHANTEIDSENLSELRAERDRLRTHEIELMTTVKQLKDSLAQYEAKSSSEANNSSSSQSLLSSSEIERIEKEPNFVNFFSRSSILMERFLHNRPRYDLNIDYNADDDEESDNVGSRPKLSYQFTFSDSMRTINRPVSAIDWSTKFPELMLASYAGNSIDENSEDSQLSLLSSSAAQGCVLLWNIHLSSRPEYEFSSDSSVLTAFFHPNHPKLILGGSASGQLLLWDTRAKKTPVNRTSLANSHTQPIYSCRLLPQINGSHSVLSVSSDGQVCVWLEDNWHTPVASYMINKQSNNSNSSSSSSSSLLTNHSNEITVNCLDFPGRDYHSIVFGSDDGSINKSRLSHTQTNDLQQKSIYETISHAHAAPIASLNFQPSTAATSVKSQPLVSSLYLTSSYDWTVKLWSIHSSQPIHEFDRARDYCFDASWHPTHPAMFVSGDATGTIELWKMGAKINSTTNSTKANNQNNNNNNNSNNNVTGSDDSDESVSLTGKGFDSPELSINVRQSQQNASNNNINSTTDSSTSNNNLLTNSLSGPAISKLRWTVTGSHLSVGNSHGEISIFELDNSLLEHSHDGADDWWTFIGQKHKNKITR